MQNLALIVATKHEINFFGQNDVNYIMRGDYSYNI